MWNIVQDPIETQIQTRLVDRLDRFGFDGIAAERTVIYFHYFPRAVKRAPWIIFIGCGFQNIRHYMPATGGHNNYLHVFLELGIIGLIVYLKFLFGILQTLKRTADRTSNAFEKLIAQDVWVAFVAVMVTMLVGESLWAQYSMFTLTGQIMALVAVATCPLNWADGNGKDEKL
jgi:hypothetical protein